MTGLLGGGFAIFFDAASGRVANLDFFVAVPGLGAEPAARELLELEVPFGEELVHYAIGAASCAVPGAAGRARRRCWRRARAAALAAAVEPALRLARDGVELPPAHAACLAMLAPVMTMREGERDLRARRPAARAGDRLVQPGLARRSSCSPTRGRQRYTGTLARALLALSRSAAAWSRATTSPRYEARWSGRSRRGYAGTRFLTRGGLSGVAETIERLPRLAASARGGARARAARGARRPAGEGDTTNLVAVDAEGNACVMTSSLGLGSGDFLPGLDLHLNTMLGETDLLRGRSRRASGWGA